MLVWFLARKMKYFHAKTVPYFTFLLEFFQIFPNFPPIFSIFPLFFLFFSFFSFFEVDFYPFLFLFNFSFLIIIISQFLICWCFSKILFVWLFFKCSLLANYTTLRVIIHYCTFGVVLKTLQSVMHRFITGHFYKMNNRAPSSYQKLFQYWEFYFFF